MKVKFYVLPSAVGLCKKHINLMAIICICAEITEFNSTLALSFSLTHTCLCRPDPQPKKANAVAAQPDAAVEAQASEANRLNTIKDLNIVLLGYTHLNSRSGHAHQNHFFHLTSLSLFI